MDYLRRESWRTDIKKSEGIRMSTLNEKLLDIYITYKDDINPPVPLETIKEYLELEGVLTDENEQQGWL